MQLLHKEELTMYYVKHTDFDVRYYEVLVNKNGNILEILNSVTGDRPYNEDLVKADLKKMLRELNENQNSDTNS